MRIGLISDTHMPSFGKNLHPEIPKLFAGVSLILHAGDIYAASVLDELETISPVLAVAGPGVDHSIGAPRVENKRVISIDGLNIGLIHILVLPGIQSDVMPGAIAAQVNRDVSLREVLKRIFGASVDVVVFGDTHQDMVETHEGILFVNPGSPTLPNQFMRPGTVGILEIQDGRAESTILHLADHQHL